MDKIKKLSEAMRYGATLKPRTTGTICRIWFDGSPRTCALGAALDAVLTARGDESRVEDCVGTCSAIYVLNEQFQETRSKRVVCPVTGAIDEIESVIINLNDEYNWTRERIADWLESEGL